MSNGTNDWWLKKLLKMDRALVEQRDEIESLRADLRAAHGQLDDFRLGAIHEREEHREQVQELLSRIQQMAPERQFKVVFVGPGLDSYFPLAITSVSSANGETTIHVERDESPAVKAAINAKHAAALKSARSRR